MPGSTGGSRRPTRKDRSCRTTNTCSSPLRPSCRHFSRSSSNPMAAAPSARCTCIRPRLGQTSARCFRRPTPIRACACTPSCRRSISSVAARKDSSASRHQQLGSTKRDLFLGLLAQGRIKLLVATEQTQVDGRGRLRWCVNSPSLNGHYQEFKTVWRPRLVLTPERAAPMQASLAGRRAGQPALQDPKVRRSLERESRGLAGELRAGGAVRSELHGPTRPHAAAMAPRFQRRAADGAAAAEGDNAMARLPLRPLSAVGTGSGKWHAGRSKAVLGRQALGLGAGALWPA